MKKSIIISCALASVIAANAAGTVFSTAFDTREEFDLWNVIDNNHDERTWDFSDANGEGKRVFYTYHGTHQADDWIISPAIVPPADGNYILKYYFTGSSYGESMDVHMASSADIEALSAGLKASHPAINDNSHENFILFSGKAGEPVHVGFHATSAPNLYRLYLGGITVETCDNPIDISATAIVSPVSGEGLGQENVTVQVKNTGLVDINAFTINISVDGEQLLSEEFTKTLLPDESAQVTLSGKLDLSVSRHNYNITATALVTGDISEGNNSVSANVRHIGPAMEPYFMGFEPDEDTGDLKFFDLNEDEGNWGVEIGSFFMNLARTGLGCLGYNYDKNNNADDWAILDGVKVDAGHHVLKFWLSGDDNYAERLSVHYGNAATPQAMTNELIRLDPYQHGPYQEVICIFELAEPQTIYIGFHAFSDKNQNWITIDDVSLDKISATEADLIIENVSYPDEYIPLTSPRDVKFTVRNVGIIDVPAKAHLLVDGATIDSKDVTIKAQETRAIFFADGLSAVEEGKHTVAVKIEADLDNNPDNNSCQFPVRILGTPDILYDFEQDEQTDDLTFRTEDSHTLADPNFEEPGWSLFSIQQHPQFGSQMLGCSVWFTDNTARADRWLVLPQVTVNSAQACFVWNAGAVNTYEGSESYRAMVSTGDDKWSDYTTALDIPAETVTRRDRGIDLGEYNGKNIYVALNIRSVNGNIITLDNLAFHGCSKVGAGIASPSSGISDSLILTIEGDNLSVNAPEATIEVYDMPGSKVISANAASVDLSTLLPGVYVARANTSGASTTLKFIRR